MRIARTIAHLMLTAALLAAAPAAASARPLEDRGIGAPRSVACIELGPIVPGQPRQTHRVVCPTSAVVADAPASISRIVTVRNAPPNAGSAWETVAIALAGAAFMFSAAALVAGRQRRSQRRRVAV